MFYLNGGKTKGVYKGFFPTTCMPEHDAEETFQRYSREV